MGKTLGLGMIMKNEARHLPRIAANIEGIFDQWVIVDTGSTDDSVAIAKALGAEVYHFDWINDFAAARNETHKYLKTDYIFWLDCDDSIKNTEELVDWKKNALGLADLWLANYHYALDEKHNPVCTFVRERVYKNDGNFNWKYFLHEGVNSDKPFNAQFVSNWAIDHLRSPDDLAKDKGRNLKVFEHHMGNGVELDPRMQYYYGKELFEAGRMDDALKFLLKANTNTKLEIHDRTLCIQYLTYLLVQKEKYMDAINLAMSGLLIAPQRAEFFVLIADAFLKMNRMKDAVPFYEAAKSCEVLPDQGFGGLIFQHKMAYKDYPRNQLARVAAHNGEYEKAAKIAKEAFELFGAKESEDLHKECLLIQERANAYKTAKECDDIVFTCLGGIYEWDEKVYREKGIGGSETACVEMALWMKKLTSRRVIVFNQRKEAYLSESGVEYVPLEQMPQYFGSFKPKLHVAWRHTYKLTNAKTLIWSHDLITPGCEKIDSYDNYLTLSNFHKEFVHSLAAIPKEKILITRNGIDPAKFKYVDPAKKNPNKVIFASSPDRGLEQVIDIMEIARATHPELELHVFYGWENLRSMNKHKEADHFDSITKRPWIKVHGNLEQSKLIKEYEDAAIWFYPTNFMETFCITALETSLCGVYPLVRKFGALPDTLADLPSRIVDRDTLSLEDKIAWAHHLTDTIDKKMWHNGDESTHSLLLGQLGWEQVAKTWLKEFVDNGECIRRDDQCARSI